MNTTAILLALSMLFAQSNATLENSVSDKDTKVSVAPVTGDLQFIGRVRSENKWVSGATVTVCEHTMFSANCEKEIFRTVTEKNGKFEFSLKRTARYEVRIIKEGYSDKIIDIDTRQAEDVEATVPAFEFEVNLDLHAEETEATTVAKMFYDVAKNKFDYELPAAK